MRDLVLIDTSVWIDFLHGEKSTGPVKSLLEENLASTHILIESELRSGSIKDRDAFFYFLSRLPQISVIDYSIVFQLIEKEKLYGKGLSFIDIALYASVKADRIKIWTKDRKLSDLCKKDGLLYE